MLFSLCLLEVQCLDNRCDPSVVRGQVEQWPQRPWGSLRIMKQSGAGEGGSAQGQQAGLRWLATHSHMPLALRGPPASAARHSPSGTRSGQCSHRLWPLGDLVNRQIPSQCVRLGPEVRGLQSWPPSGRRMLLVRGHMRSQAEASRCGREQLLPVGDMMATSVLARERRAVLRAGVSRGSRAGWSGTTSLGFAGQTWARE